MRHVAWVISRWALASWAGAATFFVVLIMGLRQSMLFDTETSSNHTRVLFPLYYDFEFVLLGLAWICGWFALQHPANPRWANRVQWGLVTFALVTALGDYFCVYRPLAEMMKQDALPMTFRALHKWTMYLNSLILLDCLVASVLSLWPTTTTILSPATPALPPSPDDKKPV